MSVPDGYSFALCLTHDVDRPYKSVYHALYHAVRETRLDHVRGLASNPYWQFEDIMAVEEQLGVRSAFYFLNEPNLLFERGPAAWLRPGNWVQHLGRYDLDEVADVVAKLDAGGWEVGLHGSYHSYADREQLAHEKRVLEDVLGGSVRGGRQHYLRLKVPETWRYQADIGLEYDASLGSSVDYGFQHGYDVFRPFDDEFVVFPLTAMEATLPDPGDSFEAAWRACEALLVEAADNDAVMTVLWHLRYFNDSEFPGYRRLYRRLVERALEADAWVGPPAALYDEMDHDGPSRGGRPQLDGLALDSS